MADEILELLRDDLASRYQADSWFDDIAVLSEKLGDVDSEIDKVVNTAGVTKTGKAGLCVVVETPLLLPPGNANMTESQAAVHVIVLEDPVNNMRNAGTKIPAARVCKRLLELTRHYRPDPWGALYWLAAHSKIQSDLAPVAYDLEFRIHLRESAYNRCQQVVLTQAGADYPYTVTMTCGDALAAIWYTFDNSFPREYGEDETEESFLYSEAITIHEPCTLRAAAQRIEYLPSNVAALTFE